MEHQETVRIVPGADTAVLLIHGIVGTPRHFRKLIPLEQAIPDDWSVYNLCLPGHGAGVMDFANSSMNQWRGYANQVFDSLAQNHNRVIVVGHSMGTLFAIQLGLKAPEKIPLLFLLAVPLRPWVRPSCAVTCLRLVFHRIREDRPMEAALRDACGSRTTLKLWQYLAWIPRFLELFGEIYRTEKVMDNLQIPCVAWQSELDELVMNRSYRVLKKHGIAQVHNLPRSSHFYYDSEDKERVLSDFRRLCADLK